MFRQPRQNRLLHLARLRHLNAVTPVRRPMSACTSHHVNMPLPEFRLQNYHWLA